MTVDLSVLSRRCAREVRTMLKELPDAGDWRVAKTKDHYFLFDGPVRVSCIANNASKPTEFIAKQVARAVKKYIATHYARRITKEN